MRNSVRLLATIALAGLAVGKAVGQTPDDPPPGMTDCQTTVVRTADGREAVVRTCRNADGQRVRVGGTELPRASFPPSAAITFRGTYQGSRFQPGRQPRRLTLDQLLRSGGTTTPVNGTIELFLRITGNAVQGSVRTDGSYMSTAISGTQQGGTCRLASADGSLTVEGECSDRGFTGKVVQETRTGQRFDGKFSAAP